MTLTLISYLHLYIERHRDKTLHKRRGLLPILLLHMRAASTHSSTSSLPDNPPVHLHGHNLHTPADLQEWQTRGSDGLLDPVGSHRVYIVHFHHG